jgi:hypothetical protein
MSNYVFAYHGGTTPQNPEEGARYVAEWKAWVCGLGHVVVNPGTPFGKSKILSANGVSDNGGSSPLSGFSILKADSMSAALEMAKGCPHLKHGTIEIAEVKEM